MVFTKIEFGRSRKADREELTDLAHEYLGSLLHSGQLCGEYDLVWQKGLLVAYVNMADRDAHLLKHCWVWTKQARKKVKAAFGRTPRWIVFEDDVPKRLTTWESAPFLFLAASWIDDDPPLHRGDDGRAIPTYGFKFSTMDADDLYFWQWRYKEHELVWLGSGTLEIPAYRELADPKSELAVSGRELCERAEQVTGVPTYYYLTRYWGRRKGEEKRRCPLCGGKWHRPCPVDDDQRRFWHFDFRCDKCRLVSHVASSDDDERHARIGEYRPRRRGRPGMPIRA